MDSGNKVRIDKPMVQNFLPWLYRYVEKMSFSFLFLFNFLTYVIQVKKYIWQPVYARVHMFDLDIVWQFGDDTVQFYRLFIEC